jgi:hypothetical protein
MRERNHLKSPDIDGMVILRMGSSGIGWVRIGFIWLRIGTLVNTLMNFRFP